MCRACYAMGVSSSISVRWVQGALLGWVLLIPLSLLAVAPEAGFPTHAIWLDKNNYVAGDEATLATLLYNGGGETVLGALVFSVDGAGFATGTFTLLPGEAKIESVVWTAVEGAHSFSARIEDETGSVAAQTTESISVTVAQAPPPPPPSIVEKVVKKSFGIAQGVVAAGTPIIAKVLGATEEFRESGADYFEQKILENSKNSAGTLGTGTTASSSSKTVSGPDAAATTTDPAPADLTASIVNVGYSIFSSRAFFYPVALLLLLGSLMLVLRVFRRP